MGAVVVHKTQTQIVFDLGVYILLCNTPPHASSSTNVPVSNPDPAHVNPARS